MRHAPLFLGLDVGTSSLKALITNGDGGVIAHASAEYPLATPHPGWSEQDPDQWVAAAHAATREALVRASAAGHADAGRRIAAIGFSGQMHGATLWLISFFFGGGVGGVAIQLLGCLQRRGPAQL